MGVALAEEALSKGARRVCLIHGPGVVVPNALREVGDGRVHLDSVVTTQEMQDSVLSNLSIVGEYDILISAGAPADYTNLSPKTGKIKTSEKPSFKLELTASKKIIAIAKERFPKTFVVAFKAEHGSGYPEKISLEAQEVFKSSNADIVVANDVGRTDIGFGSDFNEVSILTKDGSVTKLPRESKNEIAAKILDILVEEISRCRKDIASKKGEKKF